MRFLVFYSELWIFNPIKDRDIFFLNVNSEKGDILQNYNVYFNPY